MKITPGVAAIMKNFDKDTGINEIQIEVSNQANNVKITVNKYDSKPAEVTKEKSGNVYRYLQIKTTNLEDKLSNGKVTIKVEKAWLTEKGLDKNNLAMYKFNENTGEWNELNTIYKKADFENYYYDVGLSSFSYFAISEKAKVDSVGTVGDESKNDKESEERVAGTGNIITEQDLEKANLKLLLSVLGFIVVGIILFLVYNKRIKKKK